MTHITCPRRSAVPSRFGPVVASMLLSVALGGAALVAPGPATAERAPVTEVAAPAADFTHLGSTQGLNRSLRSGCHGYSYTYTIHPTTPEWALEVFLIDPRHHQLASNGFESSADKTTRRQKFTICKPSTVVGLFHIKAKLTLKDGFSSEEGYIQESTFRLCKPPKHHSPHPCRPQHPAGQPGTG